MPSVCRCEVVNRGVRVIVLRVLLSTLVDPRSMLVAMTTLLFSADIAKTLEVIVMICS